MTVLTPENLAYAKRLVDQAPPANERLRAILAPLLADVRQSQAEPD